MNTPTTMQKFFVVLRKIAPVFLIVAAVGYGVTALLYTSIGVATGTVIVFALTSVFLVALIVATAFAGYLLAHPEKNNDEEDIPSGDTTQPITGSNPTA